jgi:hypothetical protein
MTTDPDIEAIDLALEAELAGMKPQGDDATSVLARRLLVGPNCRAATRCRIYRRACAAVGAPWVSPTNATTAPTT